MLNPRERKDAYRVKGLEYTEGFDKPGTVYERHAHEMVILYTVSGSLALTLYDVEPPRTVALNPGDEFTVPSGVEHTLVTGESGWKYIAAWDPAEAARFENA